MGIALKHAWNIAGKYALEPHGTVPRFLGTLGTVPRPNWMWTKISYTLLIRLPNTKIGQKNSSV